MKAFKFLISFLALAVLFIACQKELSFESGGSGNGSQGSLQGAGGNCLGNVVHGIYKKDSTLNAGHTVDVKIDVTTVGGYTVGTDTINGVYFRATGTFSAVGTNTVNLKGFGKPVIDGTFTYTVKYDSTVCEFSITVLPASGGGGGGGGGAAVYTVNCSGAAPSYVIGTPIAGGSTVTINVNVATIGTYTIGVSPNPVQGVTFGGTSGTFTATGSQPVVLTASGTPTGSAGSVNVTISSGTSTCTFPVTFTAAPVADYYPRTTNSYWTYEIDNDPNDTVRTFVPGSVVNNNTVFMYDYQGTVDTFSYARKSGSDYFHWTNLADYLSFDNDQWVEINFLKDNKTVGDFWYTAQYTGSIFATPITVRIKYTIMQQNATVNIAWNGGANNTAYPNTIAVKETYEYLVGTTWTPASSLYGYYIDYYSKNIGWIKEESYDDTDALVGEIDIRHYQVF